MAAKLASTIVYKYGMNNIVLAELCRNSKTATENLKSYARLLNIPITNSLQNGDLSDTMLLNDNARLVLQANAVAAGQNMTIYAVNYNVLRIMSGMGGLAYSN